MRSSDFGLGAGRSNDPSQLWLEFGRDAMACRFEILMHPGEPENGPDAAVQALEQIAYLEQQLSVYLPSSELSRVNARALELPVHVSPSTMALVQLGIEIFRATDGCFDMTAASLTKAWGFFRRQGRMPTADDVAVALQRVGSDKLTLDLDLQTIQFRRDVELNPGGIGKGFAIDCAADRLLQDNVLSFAIHGGKSSIRCNGSESRRDPKGGWRIAVRHPEQSERILGTLRLRNVSLGTSGPANQFFYFQGKRYGHIIDPRTGWPSQGMLSVTVLHPSAGWADALATGLFVMGPEPAIAYCQQHPDTGMLAILPSQREGQVEVVTCNLDEEDWIPNAGVTP